MMRDPNNVHIVIDIETLGTIDSLIKLGGCPILEAAFAVLKFVDGEFTIVNRFTTPFSLKNQDERYIDAETIEWHHSKNPNYKKQYEHFINADIETAQKFNHNLTTICQSYEAKGKKIHFWSKGKDFDFTILKAYAIQQGFNYPWMEGYSFVNVHCIRDFIYFTHFDEKSIKNPNLHDALSDAVTEAKMLAIMLNLSSEQV